MHGTDDRSPVDTIHRQHGVKGVAVMRAQSRVEAGVNHQEGVGSELRAPPDGDRGAAGPPEHEREEGHVEPHEKRIRARVGQRAEHGQQAPFSLGHRIELVAEKKREAYEEQEV